MQQFRLQPYTSSVSLNNEATLCVMQFTQPHHHWHGRLNTQSALLALGSIAIQHAST